MRVAFFGNPPLGLAVLHALQAAPDTEVVVAVTQTEPPRRRGKAQALPVAEFAREQGLETVPPPPRSELAALVEHARPDVCVVAAYGHVIPPDALKRAGGKWLNVHSSLLPAYRGASPVQQAILDGAVTGVTIMEVAEALDAGPIVAQAEVPAAPEDTAATLTGKIARRGGELLLESLPGYLDGSLKPRPQDDAAATVTGTLSKASGRIDWSRSAAELERFVRAMQPWPGAWTTFRDAQVTVTSARVAAQDESLKPGEFGKTAPLAVGTGAGTLVVDRLVPAGKAEMDGSAWLNGVRQAGHFGS